MIYCSVSHREIKAAGIKASSVWAWKTNPNYRNEGTSCEPNARSCAFQVSLATSDHLPDKLIRNLPDWLGRAAISEAEILKGTLRLLVRVLLILAPIRRFEMLTARILIKVWKKCKSRWRCLPLEAYEILHAPRSHSIHHAGWNTRFSSVFASNPLLD